MDSSLPRRDWLKKMSLGMAGLLASERLVRSAEAPVLTSRALADPRAALKA
jgi:hypothetical protein